MIDDHPNLRQEPPKLVLRGPSQDMHNQDAHNQDAHTQRVFVHPDQMRPQTLARSGNPFVKLGRLWQRDPAYRVLMVAAGAVLLAGIIFAIFLASMLAQAATPANTTGATAPAAPKATSPAQPAFPTPSSGKSTKGSSQPPKNGTPVVLPTMTPATTPTVQPTQPTQPTQPAQGTFNPQIVSIPQQVRSNTVVPVTINVGQPGATVRLQVTYDQAPNQNFSGPATTDANGNVTLNWRVSVFAFKQHLVARVTAFAINQNGQQRSSQTVSVAVINRGQFNQ